MIGFKGPERQGWGLRFVILQRNGRKTYANGLSIAIEQNMERKGKGAIGKPEELSVGELIIKTWETHAEDLQGA